MSFTASQIAEIVQGDILGDYCVIASQSGISGHLTLGPQAGVGAKSGVMRDIPAGGQGAGYPGATGQGDTTSVDRDEAASPVAHAYASNGERTVGNRNSP